jgi:hypothetical protein
VPAISRGAHGAPYAVLRFVANQAFVSSPFWRQVHDASLAASASRRNAARVAVPPAVRVADARGTIAK